MQELKQRLSFLFSIVGLLVCLGKFENRQVETYVLTDSGLILRHDAVEITPSLQYVESDLSLESDELTPATEDITEVASADLNATSRMPASVVPETSATAKNVAFVIPKLGTKRKPKTMIAANDISTEKDPMVERSQKLDIDTKAMTAMLATLPQDDETLAQLPAEERTVALDLFNDVSYDAIVEHLQPTQAGGFAVQGRIQGLTGSSFSMVQENGRTTANIYSAVAQYEVRSSGQNHVVHQINPSRVTTSIASASAPSPILQASAATPAAAASAPIKTASVSKPQAVCRLNLEYPNGKEIFSQSLGEKVLWSSSLAGRDVRIKLLKGDQDLGTIARAANDGSTLVRIPALVDPDSNYKVRIEDASDPSCFDESDESFSIVP